VVSFELQSSLKLVSHMMKTQVRSIPRTPPRQEIDEIHVRLKERDAGRHDSEMSVTFVCAEQLAQRLPSPWFA
jgi:hypothetical protein